MYIRYIKVCIIQRNPNYSIPINFEFVELFEIWNIYRLINDVLCFKFLLAHFFLIFFYLLINAMKLYLWEWYMIHRPFVYTTISLWLCGRLLKEAFYQNWDLVISISFFHSYCRQPTISGMCKTFCISTYWLRTRRLVHPCSTQKLHPANWG